jgi:hypothetical protein
MSDLPRGIWDNPTEEEQQAYCLFVDAWNLSEDEYEGYYREYLSQQETVAAFAYEYDSFSCGTCDPDTDGQETITLEVPPIEHIDADATYNWLEGGEKAGILGPDADQTLNRCGHLHFGYSFPIVFDNPIWQNTITAGWVHFDFMSHNDGTDSTPLLPSGSVIKTAYLRMWPDREWYSGDTHSQINTVFMQLCYNGGINDGDHDFYENFCTDYIADVNETGYGLEWKGDDGWPLNPGPIGNYDTSIITEWNQGIPVDSGDIGCILKDQLEGNTLNDINSKTLIRIIAVPRGIGEAPGQWDEYITEKVELIVTYDLPTFGVLVGGAADIEQLGVIYEEMDGGVLVSGETSQGITGLAEGGAKAGGVVRQFLFYTATGGVVVERADVELFLEFEEYNDSTTEDTSSHERHAELVNMDSTNSFVDGRKANNKVIDFGAQ